MGVERVWGFVFCVEAVLCGKAKVVENDRKAKFGTAMEDRSDGAGGWIVCGDYEASGLLCQ